MEVRVIQGEDVDQAAADQAFEQGRSDAALSVEGGEDEWNGAKQALAAGLPQRAILNRDGTVQLALAYPLAVQVGDKPKQTYEHFDFKRLKGKDMRALAACDPADTIPQAVMRSTGLPLGRVTLLLDEADAADLNAIAKVISFLSGVGARPGT